MNKEEDVVEQVVRVARADVHRLVQQLFSVEVGANAADMLRKEPLDLAQRESPFAEVVRYIIGVANGTIEPIDGMEVASAIQSICEVLFSNSLSYHHVIPEAFWQEHPLGRACQEARERASWQARARIGAAGGE